MFVSIGFEFESVCRITLFADDGVEVVIRCILFIFVFDGVVHFVTVLIK